MVKHVILWTLKNEYSKEEKEAIKAEIKAGLEGLAGQIPGLLEIHVNINGLESSNADLMLDSTFTDEAALKGYSVHPAHVAVANGKVVSVVNNEETGLTMTVDLGNGYQAVYGQLKDTAFEPESYMEAGATLGYVSEPTKYYSKEGSNLYFAMTKDGVAVDPLEYLP